MKLPSHIQKWLAGILGAVSLILVLNLVLQYTGARPGLSRPGPGSVSASTRDGSRYADDLARYDPVVRLDLLQKFAKRPLPKLERSPFEFVAPPPSRKVEAAGPAQPPPPPPPPPILLKPMGYSEKPGGVREAFVTLEDQVYTVHERDTVGGKYKILKIAPQTIAVEDETTHQTAELPIPQ
jgi:hypothetical protein